MTAALHSLYEPAHAHGFTAAKGKTFEGSDAIMEEIAQAMHDGRITDGFVDPKLMQWTADHLTAGLFDGFEVDDAADAQTKQLQDIMRDNVQVFSGFKTYQTLKAASDELMDEDGQFRSFSEFKKRILAIDQQYNVNYLRSEYELAVARGMAAEHWHAVQAEKAIFPWLRWSTAGDDRVRPEHQALDGIEKPVDDEFWKTHWIPLSWGCRCDIEQLRRPSGNGKDLPREQWPVASPMFFGNVGIDGNIFPKGHPYYAVESKAAKRVNAEVDALAEKMLLPTTATKPSGPPVSTSAQNKARGKVKGAIDEAMTLIDATHGDGKLMPLPFYSGTLDPGVYGRYLPDWRAGTAVDIIIVKSKHMVNSVLHEAGHWLDHIGIGNGKWGTEKQSKEMKELFKAMDKTKGVKNLRNILKTGYVQDKEGKDVALFYNNLERIENYLLHPRELWARSYNQYIVAKNGRQDLQDLLKQWDDDLTFMGVIREQWTPEDFAPLVPKFDAIFKQQGWQTK